MNIFGCKFGLDIDDRNIDGSTFFLVLYLIIFVGFMCALGYLAKEASEDDPVVVTSINYNNQELIVDSKTSILYYDSPEGLLPYYSENGKLCKYIDSEIREID